jgi:hypothetical protein
LRENVQKTVTVTSLPRKYIFLENDKTFYGLRENGIFVNFEECFEISHFREMKKPFRFNSKLNFTDAHSLPSL